MTNARLRLVRILLLSGACALGVVAVLWAQDPQPQANRLPAPSTPSPNFGRVVPRPQGAAPKAPAGFTVSIYAEDIPGARWMEWAPNGDLFVSQFIQNSITVLRDTNKDGKPDARSIYLKGAAAPGGRGGGPATGGAPRGGRGTAAGGPLDVTRPSANPAAAAVPCAAPGPLQGTVGLQSPMGMAFHNGYLYIANTDGIVRYKYTTGDLMPQGAPEKLVDYPAGGNHGWRNLIFNPAGTKMYVAVGSASNNDAGEDCRRAAILEFNPDGTGYRIFASGIRNPEGLAWQPGTNTLWTAVNERDNLGDDLVPDYATSVKDGGFYGWPYSYIGQNYDPRFTGGQPDLVKRAIVPDVLIGAHSAALGITFYTGNQFPQRFRNGAFVALHGSWNRSRAHGYRVIFIPFQNGKPGPVEDFLTGFIVSEGGKSVDGSNIPITAWGRPVSLIVAADGSLLIADDGGDRIWQVRYTGGR